MYIEDARVLPAKPRKLARDILLGTIFTGNIYDAHGVWLRTQYTLVNLMSPQYSHTYPSGIPCDLYVTEYEERKGKVVLE